MSTTPEIVNLTPITRAPLVGDTFETFANYFMIEAIVSLDRDLGSSDAIKRLFPSPSKISEARVCLTVNGIQLPFIEVLRRFHASWERLSTESAQKIVADQFEEKTSPIFSLLDDLRRRLEESLGVKNT